MKRRYCFLFSVLGALSALFWVGCQSKSSSPTPTSEGGKKPDAVLPVDISVVSDLEGSFKRLDSYIRSPGSALKYVDEAQGYVGPTSIVMANDNIIFINLGDNNDSTDQVAQDLIPTENILVLEVLLSLKARFPKQVVFVMGNRDMNKLRLLYELSLECLPRPADGNPNACWRFQALIDYANKSDDFKDYNDGKVPDKVLNDQLIKGRFLLAMNLGAGNLIRALQKELKERNEPSEPTDVITYLLTKYANKGGIYYQYLEQAVPIYYYAPLQALFAHAGVLSDASFGFIPGLPKVDIQNNEDLLKWIIELTEWVRERVLLGGKMNGKTDLAVIKKVYEFVSFQEPPGEPKIVEEIKDGKATYTLPWTGVNENSVVLVRPFIKDKVSNKDNLSDENVPKEKLNKSKVKFMFGGHSPLGDSLVMMTDANKTFWTVLMDTSKANPPRTSGALLSAKGILTATSQVMIDKIMTEVDFNSENDPELGLSTIDGATGNKTWNLGKDPDGNRIQLYYDKVPNRTYSGPVYVRGKNPQI